VEPLTRTAYRDPATDLERDGSAARRETLLDHEQYQRPLERVHNTALHSPGVATGLEVLATEDTEGLRVLPGVALTARGDHVVLAAGGRAIVAGSPVPVTAEGAHLPTTGLDGEHVLTIAWDETFDRRTFDESQGRRFQTDHTPRLTFHRAADPIADTDVVLAGMTFDNGAVTSVDSSRRRHCAVRLTLQAGVHTEDGPDLSVGSQNTGELVATDDREVHLSVPGAFGTFRIHAGNLIVRGSADFDLWFDGVRGNLGVGIGNFLPTTALHLPDRGLQIGNGRDGDENFHWVVDGEPGPRSLRLYRGNHGSPGRAHALSVATPTGQVGVNVTAPRGRLHVSGAGDLHGEDADGVLTASDVPLVVQSSDTAIGVLDGRGRPVFALNVEAGGLADPSIRGTPTFYDNFEGTWHSSITLHQGRVGIGTFLPQARLEVRDENTFATGAPAITGFSSGPNNGVEGTSQSGHGVHGRSVHRHGVVATTEQGVSGLHAWGPRLAAVFDNHVQVNGTIFKQDSQFRIDHPLDPDNRYLCHSAVESDEMRNVYDGRVTLDADGAAEIRLAEWCEELNDRFCYQLTPIGGPAAGLHVTREVADGGFGIGGGAPGMTVCWLLTGIRRDPYAKAFPLVVEMDKPEADRNRRVGPIARAGVGPQEESPPWRS
jgi:hypothetical protein